MKIETIGDVDKQTKSIKLANACIKITKGTTPTTLGMEFSKSGVPFVRVNNFKEGMLNLNGNILFVSQNTHEALARSIIKEGDVLLSIAGTIGRICVVPPKSPDANCNQAVCIIRVDDKLLINRYLQRWLNSASATSQLLGRKVTGVISNLSLTNVRNLQIPLPPLTEQKRIAKTLDATDALRTKRRESLAQLDDFLKSTFLDMFGDPVTNPMGWPTEPLEALCERIIDCPHSTPHYADEKTDFLCVRSSEIQNGNLVLAKARHVSATVYNKRIARHEPQAGEVVYTREGGRLGLAGIIPQNKKVCLGQRMMLFGGNPKVATNTYIWGFLHCPAIYRKVIAMSGGGAAPRVNIKQLRQLKATRPPLALQTKFAAIVQSVEQQKSRMKTHLTELDTLFAALQQRAFNGEL